MKNMDEGKSEFQKKPRQSKNGYEQKPELTKSAYRLTLWHRVRPFE